MSGGHFDYAQFRMTDIASQIEEDMGSYGFCTETYNKFSEAIATLKRAEAMVTRIDWLISGDDSEETFHERWEKQVP